MKQFFNPEKRHKKGELDNYCEEPIYYSSGHSYANGLINIQHVMKSMWFLDSFFKFVLLNRAFLEDKCGFGIEWHDSVSKQTSSRNGFRYDLQKWQQIKLEAFRKINKPVIDDVEEIWKFVEKFGKITKTGSTSYESDIEHHESKRWRWMENDYAAVINPLSVEWPVNRDYRNTLVPDGKEKEVDLSYWLKDKGEGAEMWFGYFEYTVNKLSVLPEFKKLAKPTLNKIRDVMNYLMNPNLFEEVRKTLDKELENSRGVILTSEIGLSNESKIMRFRDFKPLKESYTTENVMLFENYNVVMTKLQDAMTNKFVCSLYYRAEKKGVVLDGYRVIEPYAVGVSRTGNIVLRAWLIRGASKTGQIDRSLVPGWRLFRIDRISAISHTLQKFDIPRKGFNPEDKGMTEVMFTAKFDETK